MKKYLSVVIYLLTSLFIYADNVEISEIMRHYIGGAAGMSTGYGLSYRYWPGDLGTQIVFSPFYDGEILSLNAGTALLKPLFEGKYSRLFLYIAANGTYQNSPVELYDDTTEDYIDSGEYEDIFTGRVGIGPGLEIYLFKNIALDIMFGYSFGNSYDTILGFTAEAALYYRF